MKKRKISNANGFSLGIGALSTGFSGMFFNNDYEDRKVARYGSNEDDLIIDTAFTTDTKLYETGVIDKRFYDTWIIVQEYETKEEAIKGHNQWIKRLTGKKPPKSLLDIHIDERYQLI